MNDTKKPARPAAQSPVLVLVIIPSAPGQLSTSGQLSTTGIQSRSSSDAYRTGWDNVFARNGSSAPN